jgi:hypothetical protein
MLVENTAHDNSIRPFAIVIESRSEAVAVLSLLQAMLSTHDVIDTPLANTAHVMLDGKPIGDTLRFLKGEIERRLRQ